MNKWQKTCDNEIMTIYQKGNREFKYVVYFDKSCKTIHVTQEEFIRNDEPRLVPMTDATYYSCKYGYTQVGSAYLSLEDLEFITSRAKELFR